MQRRLRQTSITSILVLFTLYLLSGRQTAAAQGGQVPAADGAQVFQATCSGCHQASGEGIPGAFPPLAGHVQDLYEADDGPRYLASVVLFGLQGPIVVDGQTYDGQMPSFFNLSDDQIAAVLNHVLTELGGAEPPDGYETVAPEDVAAARRGALSPALVYQRRPEFAEAEGGAQTAELADASYALEQLDRARPVYGRYCDECHGADLTGGLIGGPPLAGFVFRQKWGGTPLSGLYTYMSTQMPQGSPGSLTPQQYADILALILSRNGHEAGDAPIVPDLDVLGTLQVKPN